MDPVNPEQLDILDDIDPELEAIFADDEGAASEEGGTQEEGTQGVTDELTERLQAIGLPADRIPSDLSPEARSLITEIAEKEEKRVRDFQSGFDRRVDEFQVKANVYDQLMALPQFHTFLNELQSGGRRPEPVVEEKPKLDLASLPADPVERLGHIVRYFAKEAIDDALKPVNEQVGAVGNVVRNIGWESFVAKHPDAPDYSGEMRRLIGAGLNLEEAYRYAKGASVDEKAIEDRTLTRVKGYVEKRNKAAKVGLKTNAPKGSDPASDIVAYAKEHGHEAAVNKAIREAMEQHLGKDY